MKDSVQYTSNAIAIIFSALQSNEVFSIISWVLTLIATLVTIAYTIWRWWVKAHEDGKITKEEIEDGAEIVKDSLDKLNELKDKEDH